MEYENSTGFVLEFKTAVDYHPWKHVGIGLGFDTLAIDLEADGEDWPWKVITQQLEVKGSPRAYVIRNSFLKPDYEVVKPKLMPISGNTIDSLIRTQGIGDMYRIYLDCQRDGMDFNLAFIPGDFDVKPNEEFDPVYMGKLFEVGYQMAKNGYPWDKGPPGFE